MVKKTTLIKKASVGKTQRKKILGFFDGKPKEPEIIDKKHWVTERGSYPSRIVLLKRFNIDGTIREYSTHMEVDQNGVQAFYHGNYFDTLPKARNDFDKRQVLG